MLLGNPSSATTNTASTTNYLIQRDQYALSYNDNTRQPNWVSWNLTAEDIGSAGRSSSFFQDTTLPSGYYQVLTSDYSGSGYDRGHMCPSADRTATRADNDFTFYMSNMIPQAPDNNQGVWANFETYCRSLATAGNEVLIISGPSLFSGSRISSGVAVAGFTWKIVVVAPLGTEPITSRITTSTRVIAIKIPNTAGVRTTPWQNFVTTVAQIEADTGYTFFSELPSSVASVLKTVVDGQPVTGLPTITSPPVGQSVAVGGSALFTVSATGDAPLAYQWMLDGEEIVGATSSSLTVNNVTLADMGSYTVRVSNSVGAVTSTAASLVVTGVAPQLVSSPVSITVGAGSSATFTVAALGSPTLTYQWRKDGMNLTGATFPTLTITGAQQDNAGSYDVVVSNGVPPAVTSSAATLTVTPAAPAITQQPANRTVTAGTTATFTVAASGTAPLTYQWRKGGVNLSDTGNISGSSTATLTITNPSLTDGGNFDVVVTNSISFATSNTVTLTVNPAPSSTNLSWGFSTPLPAPLFGTADPTSGLISGLNGGTLTQGNNNGTTTLLTNASASSVYVGATGNFNAGAAARTGALNTASGGSAYFEFTLTPSSGKQLSVTSFNFGSRSTTTGPQAYSVFTSVDNYSTPIATGNFTNNSTWALKTNTISNFTSATGTAVTFRLFGHSGTGSASANTANWRIDDLTLAVGLADAPPTPPAVSSRSPASGATSVAATTPITLTFNQPVTVSDSWFAVSSAFAGPLSATVTGGPTTFTLTTPSSFTPGDTITVTTFASKIRDQATGLLSPAADETFSFTILVPQAPSITTQPVAVTTAAGETATFSVAASGTAPFSYQWRKDGTAITGNTSALTSQLTLTNVQAGSAGSYDVVVTNGVGAGATSSAVALQVTAAAPTITTQPTSRVGVTGGSSTFTVAVKGTEPFTYQWRKGSVALVDGNGIAGATTASLTLSSLTLDSAGSYDVVISNGVGTAATSNAASLAVNPPADTTVTWDFATANPTSGLPSTVTGGTVTSNNNNGAVTALSSTSASGSYTGASAGNNIGAAARVGALDRTASTGSAYFEFTLTPQTGSRLRFLNLSFGNRSTSTAPQAYSVFTSADNFTTALATGTLANNSNWSLQTPLFAGITLPVDTALTVRIYGHNGAGTPGTSTINWRIDDLKVGLSVDSRPAIVTSPTTQNAVAGDSVNLSVNASGTAPLTYSWRKGGQAITGNASAATATLTLSGVTVADSGDYDVVVSNSLGSATSQTATLTVISRFDAWRAAQFTTSELADPLLSGPQASFLGDGIPNLVKYALGLDPKVTAPADRLPAVSVTETEWVYTYRRDPTRTDVTLAVETTTNFSTWSSAGLTPTQVGTSGGLETWEVRVSRSTAPTQIFFRLKATN
jgi:DNA/RNA endonuclease G (NUC1)